MLLVLLLLVCVCTGIDGDHALQQGLYEHAILAYSKEITENPSALVYHYKRSMAYLLANKHQLAINDLEHVISNDKTFHKAYTQRAKILVKLGRCAEAKRDLAHVVEHSGEARELENSASRCVQLDAVVREFYRNKDWGNLLNSVQELGDIATNYKEVLEMEMEALLETRDYERLIASSGKLLMFDKNNIHAYLQRGRAYYLTGNDDMALKHYKEGLRFNPEHKGLKDAFRKLRQLQKFTESAEAAVQSRDFGKAIEEYDSAIKVDPLHLDKVKRFHVKKCEIFRNLRKFDDAVSSCTDALNIDNNMVEALNIRGDLYLKKEMFEEAVRDYENAHRIDPHNHSINENLGKARLELKKSQRKDYYKILGVSQNADEATIKRAYRKGALKYHPDKQVGLSPEEQQNAEKLFKDVAESYEILSNPEKRQRYDSGEDLQEQNQGFNPFQGGGFPFPFGGDGGNFQFHFKFN